MGADYYLRIVWYMYFKEADRSAELGGFGPCLLGQFKRTDTGANLCGAAALVGNEPKDNWSIYGWTENNFWRV